MIPEGEYIRKEIIIREMDFPPSVSLTKKSLLRWCCLSLGLISKNETRDKGFLVFDTLFTFLFSKKEMPATLDIQEQIKQKYSIEMSEKLIRYHLNRLIGIGLLQRDGLKYKINPSPSSEKRNSVKESFDYWVRKEIEKNIQSTSEALDKLQKLYEQKK